MLKNFGAPWSLDRGDGTVIQFPLLKMRQLAELQNRLRAVRVAAAKKSLDPKLKPTEATQFLTSVESSTIDIVDLRTWVQSPEGCEAALRLSLTDAGYDEVDLHLPVDDQIVAALRVTGWTPPETPKAAASAAPSANP
jgi:hypothetical protein